MVAARSFEINMAGHLLGCVGLVPWMVDRAAERGLSARREYAARLLRGR